MPSSHDFKKDKRNNSIKINININFFLLICFTGIILAKVPVTNGPWDQDLVMVVGIKFGMIL